VPTAYSFTPEGLGAPGFLGAPGATGAPGAMGGLGAAAAGAFGDGAEALGAPGAPRACGVPAAPTVCERSAPHCAHLRAPSIAAAPQMGQTFCPISTVGGLKHMVVLSFTAGS